MAKALFIVFMMWLAVALLLYGGLTLVSRFITLNDPVFVAEVVSLLITGFILTRLG